MTTLQFSFLLAFDVGYARMATALVHSLNYFHPGRAIRVYAMDEDLAPLQHWAKGFRDVEVRRYELAGRLSFGDWHPLIWAKLEAFAQEEQSCQVVLDVDQILYRDVSACVAEALAAGKAIAASPDISSLREHVLASFTGEPLERLEPVRCFNAGAMIIRPSRRIYRELMDLAEQYHPHVRLPEQAILNLWARHHGGHHDLGDQLMIQPWSSRVLEPEPPACLIHFWTPRPAFFGPSPLRPTEPSLEECLSAFEQKTGVAYPLERFECDFLLRLQNKQGDRLPTIPSESTSGLLQKPEPIAQALDADATFSSAAKFVAIASRHIANAQEGRRPVATALSPSQIAARFDEPLPMWGHSLEDVVERLERDVVTDAIQLMHPMYMGHQVSAPLPAAIWTEPVIAALNQSMTIWEMSPTATAIERQIVRWMCQLLGFGAQSGGTLTSGGTEATFTALLAARAAALPNAWEEGIGENAPVVLYGEHAHYAITRAVAELGLGVRRAIPIPTQGFRMDIDALDKQLAKLGRNGVRVMAVVATAGSTATGHFDDLNAIADLCSAHRAWLHVDGAHGASALLSPAHRHRLRGVERADSVAWDAHKMMLLPLTTGMLLVRHESALEAAFAQQAPYLFQQPAGEPSWDQGKRTFTCARRADAIKLWMTLQRYGAANLGALYEQLCDVARALHTDLGSRQDFETIHEPESNILCFRFVGNRARDPQALDELNRELRARYNASGHGWITTTVVRGQRVLRAVVMNPRTTSAHVRALVQRLGELGATLQS